EAFRATVMEKKPFDQEYRIYRRDDHQLRWLHGRGRVQFDGDDAPRSVLGTVQDITEHRHAAEALRRAHEELEQRVRERTAELAAANESLAKQHRTLKHLLHSSDNERQVIAYEIHDGLAQQLAGAIMQFQTYRVQADGISQKTADAYESGM